MKKIKLLNNNKDKKKKLMKIINKNELTVLIIALMLVTAGYLDYLQKIEDEEISSDVIEETSEIIFEDEIAKTGDATLVNSEIEEAVSEVINDDLKNDEKNYEERDDDSYFVSSKLERTNMYSQTIENYQKLLENSNVSEEQKAIATQEIAKINQVQNAIMISENLLLAKGFDKCVIFVNDSSINIIVGKQELTQEEIAQIQNIVSRELNASIDNIHISIK